MAGIRFIVSAILIAACLSHCLADFYPPPDNDERILAIPHERIRRFIRIVSKKPGPDAEPEMGIGLKGHVKNLLSGGSVNVQLKIGDVRQLAKYIPFLKNLSREEKKEFVMLEKDERRMGEERMLVDPRSRGGREEP